MTFAAPSSSIIQSGYTAKGEFSQDQDQRERILIVDDSTTVRFSFMMQLSKKYECDEAKSVSEAFEKLKNKEFSLVISDVIMPGLSGVELLRRVVDSYPDTAVIMVTGVDRPQRALDAVRLGAYDYLIKPCEVDVVELAVERALERRRLLINGRRYKRDLEARNLELIRGKTELQRLQAQVVHNEKMASLGQLSAGIAHEINNPIGFVHTNLEILSEAIEGIARLLKFYDSAELPQNAAAGAREIKDAISYDATIADLPGIIADCREGSQRVRDIVQNLRTFSRLDEAEFKKIDVHEGIESTVRLLSRYFSNGNIVLRKDFGTLPMIDAYAGQLNQVWMNLLANAAQAVGNEPGEVRISTSQVGDDVVIAITDTGKGISQEHLKRIFEPFFTTKAVGEGTGLGLSITFGIVEKHGGSIEVNSKINQGTTFMVKLPIHIRLPLDPTNQ